ncbi:MAG: hypothetical protein ABJC66_03160 [Gammaproteobacteria bacterium]
MTNRGPDFLRRRLALASLAYPASLLLQSCAATFKPLHGAAIEPAAQALLSQSAVAHGSLGFSNVHDISVSYTGHWRAIVAKLQPVLVDAGYRGGSEERLLLEDGIVAQAHTGPDGKKQVVRTRTPLPAGSLRVWRNGNVDDEKADRDAAALVADSYLLFLLGPMLLSSHGFMERMVGAELGGLRRITVDDSAYECDPLRIRLRPGMGFAAVDDLMLFIDRESHLMRRVRFTLNGLESTRGAIAEVDIGRFTTLEGISWPTHYYERLLRPVPLPVHEWRMSGLDLNRGLVARELTGSSFLGKAVAPAATIT